MAVKKIENYNIHQNPATNENQFDVENYLNVNWNKTKEAVNNNADELISIQEEVSALETDNTTNKKDISEIKEEQTEQNTNIEKLEQEDVDIKEELEKTKKEFNDYAIHGQASGEFIHLTDSAKSSCKIDIKGNVKQTVTEQSANELDLTKLTITEKPNVEIDNISANEVTFHATNNTTTSYYLRFKTILKQGTYYLRKLYEMLEGTAVPGNNGSGVIFISKSDWSKEFVRLYADSEKGNFTLTEDTEVFITLILAKTENGKIRFYNLMLSNEDTEYVPFVPDSPSLDYPAPIQTVGSNINLIESLEFGDLSTSDGKTESTSSNFAITDYIEVEKLADYTASKNISSQIVVYKYDQSKNYLGFENNSSISYTFETNTNIKYVRLRFATTTLDIEAKLEKGKVATSYSSFGQGSVKVTSCNKNFLDLEKEATQTKNGITASTNNENELTLNGTSTTVLFISLCENELSINTNANNFKSKKLKKGSYTLSIEKSGETTDNNINLLIRKAEDLSSTGNISVISNIGSKTSALSKFTLEQDQEVKIWLWLNTGNTLSNFKLKIQLEEGDTATEIIGNEQNSITVSIQQEMFSRFDRQNNKELHDYKKIILNETQNYTLLTTTENYLRFMLDLSKTFDLKNGFKVYCENLKVVKQSTSTAVNEEKIIERDISLDKQLQIVILKSRLTEPTVEGLKQYLATNNIVAYCELEEATKLDLTQEQIEALEKLDEMQTYKNITNITTDSIAILDVDYKKDLETWQKQQDDRITALEELLNTTQTSAMLIENLENDLLKEVE